MKRNQRKQEFLNSVDVLLTEIGAAVADAREDKPTYVFPTWYGVLQIQPIVGTAAPEICCQFLHPERVQEIAGDFNRNNGRWNHHLWPGWMTGFGPGLDVFAQLLNDIALSRDPISSTDKPFRRADGSAVRFCQTASGVESVYITTTSGELWHQSPEYFYKGSKPRLRVTTAWGTVSVLSGNRATSNGD